MKARARSLTIELHGIEPDLIQAGAAEDCDHLELMSNGWLATRAYIGHLLGETMSETQRQVMAWMAARFAQAVNESAKPARTTLTLVRERRPGTTAGG